MSYIGYGKKYDIDSLAICRRWKAFAERVYRLLRNVGIHALENMIYGRQLAQSRHADKIRSHLLFPRGRSLSRLPQSLLVCSQRARRHPFWHMPACRQRPRDHAGQERPGQRQTCMIAQFLCTKSLFTHRRKARRKGVFQIRETASARAESSLGSEMGCD